MKTKKVIKYSKRGFAIPVALAVAFTLLLSAFYLEKQTGNTIVLRAKGLEQLQAELAVKSAFQHAILKTTLLPTQLYDAAAISEGKNPFFDFSEYSDSIANSNEMKEIFGEFIHLGNNRNIKRASYSNVGPRYIVKSIECNDNNSWNGITLNSNSIKEQCGQMLKKFSDDLCFDSSSDDKFKAINLASYNYKIQYKVSDMKVLALNENKQYNEEAVEINVIATITTALGKDVSKESKMVVRVKRNEN